MDRIGEDLAGRRQEQIKAVAGQRFEPAIPQPMVERECLQDGDTDLDQQGHFFAFVPTSEQCSAIVVLLGHGVLDSNSTGKDASGVPNISRLCQ